MPQNIQLVSDNLLCSACGACKAICNKEAIDFHFTSIGRLKADVNDNCVNCGMCINVCPSLNKTLKLQNVENPYIGDTINTYIGRATNENIYKNAQSGGLCTALTTLLLETNKVDAVLVCKICKGTNPYPQAIVVRDKKDLLECQRSCYIPIDLLSALKNISSEERVAIVGIPCQIAGVSLLQQKTKKFSNIIYKIGLICDRVHCKGYQDTILSYIPKHKGERLIRYRKKDFVYTKKDFVYERYKQNYYPYKTAPVVVEMNDRSFIFPNIFRFLLKDLFTAPRCRVCADKLNINADVVLGDPWGMSGVDWDHGDSLAISRTPKGEDLLKEALLNEYITLKKSDFQEVIKGQAIENRPRKVGAYSEALSLTTHVLQMNSYIYEQYETNLTSNEEILSAIEDIKAFQKLETTCFDKIIKKAQLKIANGTGIWHPSLFGTRVKIIIKSIIGSITKKVHSHIFIL